MQTITDHNDIDLDKHALIEASAGTGKTYTIENLVVRMLVEENVTLDNILLLTFTEKATGELKKRIRENIASALEKVRCDKKKAKKLQESLTNFDTASIYTIHGFCHSILRDFSFEIGQSFDFEVVSDEPLYEKLLYEQMRKDWHKEFGEDLPEMLEASDFPSVNRIRGGSQWINKVIRIAQSCHFGMNEGIEPEIFDDINIRDIKRKCKERLLDILRIVGGIDKNSLTDSDLYRSYNNLNFNRSSKSARLDKVILPLLRYLNKFNVSNEFNINDLYEIFKDISLDDYKKRGISCLIPEKWNKTGSNLDKECPSLKKIVAILDQVIKDIEITSYILPVWSIKQLKKDIAKYKMRNGLISFNDMLMHVAHAIDSVNNKAQLEKLRTRYRYALVDEFQDTDAIQWNIFHEIFIKGESQRLFLIGDPKQAIYSFRGADVFTYLGARKELKALANKGKAVIYSLETNYRSGPKLLNAFNQLFKKDSWFGEESGESDDGKIYYHDALSSKDVVDGLTNERGRAPFTVVRISNEAKGPVARRRFAEFIAYEIDNIVNHEYIKDKNNDRKLNCGDICILVRSKLEVSVIEKELDKLDIPHTYYKKPGLYQSDEAMELLFLFRFIERPNDESAMMKGLLTPFFCIPVYELRKYADLNPSHPVRRLVMQWHDFTLYRKWSELFQSVIEDSGLIMRELQKSSGERKLINYRHIIQNLEDIAYGQNLDFTGIINCLESYRSQIVEVEMEMDVHQIESEKSRVKIMTIHSSKGLEFPIVFLAGGFTKSAYYQFYKYHRNENVIYDLAKSNKGKEKHAKEEELENRRLYYVALTRAKYRVYVPGYKPLKKMSFAGPVPGFIYNSIHSVENEWQDEKREEKFVVMDIDIAKRRNEIDGVNKVSDKRSDVIPDPLLPHENFDFQERMVKVESFSSLNHKRAININEDQSVPLTINYPDAEKEKRDDELDQKVSHIEFGSGSMIPPLPRGRHVGNMFHEILENIDFSKIAKAKREGMDYDCLLENNETITLIEKRLALNSIESEHREVVAKIVWNTLITPIIEVGNDFVLSDLNDDSKIHELEFYYPAANSEKVVLPDGISFKNGFYTGFIDMVFRYKELYFIVDWKSNYIATGYSPEDLESCMNESNYHLQCRIYTEALILWLKQNLGGGFDYEKHFGGVFYLFLRGMGTGLGNGVYYYSPDKLRSVISDR